jgi:hypothetical protein
MTDENTMVAVDSLVANEFHVELDGEELLGIFRVDGLTTFKINAAGAREFEPFQLVKMVQRDGNNPFNKWLRETMATLGSERPRRELAVVAVDDGVETRRWVIEGASISEVSYSSFDNASSEMVEERVTIHYEGLQEIWSATPNLE